MGSQVSYDWFVLAGRVGGRVGRWPGILASPFYNDPESPEVSLISSVTGPGLLPSVRRGPVV